MNLFSCARQEELAAALRRRRWPDACSEELQKHVDGCNQCREFLRVARALHEARQEAMPQARLVPPGIIWWRAQLRRRNAEIERVERPLVLVEAFVLVCSLAFAVALTFAQRGIIGDCLRWLAEIPYSGLFGVGALWSTTGGATFWGAVAAAAAMIGVLGGFVAYLAVRAE